MKNLEITYGMITKKGERAANEDYIGNFEDKVFVLCDGLGGHGNGDVASKFVVEQMIECYQHREMSMEESIQYSQEKLLEKQKKENEEQSMKTTLTCLEISDGKAKYGHVGDSRIYLFRNGKYKQRSLDHSIPQMLVQRGAIKEKEIRNHPDRSRLLRVMGTSWDSPKYQVTDNIKIDNKTTFLLCSDGFWELIDEKKMSSTLRKAKSPQEWLDVMEKIINENGQGSNMDNYSAIAVFIR